mgnify:CR=1 FL=1
MWISPDSNRELLHQDFRFCFRLYVCQVLIAYYLTRDAIRAFLPQKLSVFRFRHLSVCLYNRGILHEQKDSL